MTTRYALVLAALFVAGCTQPVIAPPAAAPDAWSHFPGDTCPSARGIRGGDTVSAELTRRKALSLSPPDTLAIYVLHDTRVFPPVPSPPSVEWMQPIYREPPPFITVKPAEYMLRLVVFADGTARIERHDGASWGALKLR